MEVEYDDEAVEEAMAAAAWYESRQEGLVRRFLSEWKAAESRMIAAPELNRIFGGGFRRCRFEVFPFALIYRISDNRNLQVIAVMHQSREPRLLEVPPPAIKRSLPAAATLTPDSLGYYLTEPPPARTPPQRKTTSAEQNRGLLNTDVTFQDLIPSPHSTR